MKNIKSLKISLLLSLLAFFYSIDASSAVRKVQNLNSNWQFIREDVKGAKEIKFSAENWKNISVPHNWGFEDAQIGNKKYYRGVGWYRRELTIIPELGKRYFIRFEAVSTVTDVYINGILLGQHSGAFSAFTFEITKYLSKSGSNILAVRASNAPTQDVAPLSGDFNIYGGIYRSVYLLETADICFNLTDYSSPGVSWLQSKVTKEKAVLDILTWINNGTDIGLDFNFFPKELNQIIPKGLCTLKAKVIDTEGKLVAKVEKSINLSPHQCVPFNLQMEINKPHLWNGTIDPYLYSAIIEIYQNGILIDEVVQPLGLRSFYVDPNNGFFLNGKPYRLRGVAKHQDRKDKGWAVSNEDLEQDMNLIKEMGVNAVRCAHYQHSDYWFELCDKAGIMVWAEIPQVDYINESFEFVTTTRNQWLELIRQNINHPSIFAWGMFNEVTLSKADPHRSFVDLQNLAKAEDPTRYTTAATCHVASPEMNKITDIMGWNRYPGWYDPYADTKNDTLWNKYQPTSKNGGFCFSEYGAGANIEQHEQNPEQPIPGGFWHPEEWQSKVHEAALESYSKKPYIWGSFVWNMFDFSAANRNEGGKKGINDKGLVTFDRSVKKDAFYFYKANWNQQPMLYLTSKRHNVRNEVKTPVKVYCNIDTEVVLTVNGKKIGAQLPNAYKVIVWKDVLLTKGKNKVIVSAKKDGIILIDQAIWIYDSEAVSLKPQSEIIKSEAGNGGIGN